MHRIYPSGNIIYDIYRVIIECFIPYRKLEAEKLDEEQFMKTIKMNQYCLIRATGVSPLNICLMYGADNDIMYSTDKFNRMISKLEGDILIATSASPPKNIYDIIYGKNITICNDYIFKINIVAYGDGTKYEILDDKTAAEVVSNISDKKADIKIMYSYDTQAIWLGARPGQIVKITRISPSTGQSVDYRRVVLTHKLLK